MILLMVQVMIRPRIGNFVYKGVESETMQQDMIALREEGGVAGFVTGCLFDDGTVDIFTLAL